MATTPIQESMRTDLSQAVFKKEGSATKAPAEEREGTKDTKVLVHRNRAFEELRRRLGGRLDAKLRLEVDKDLNRVVVKILDGETEEVIRQVPVEELLDIAKKLKEIEGLLFREEV